MIKDPENFNSALVPCIGPECDNWDNGDCFYIHKVKLR